MIHCMFLKFQNSVAFVLSLAQMSLFVIYPSKSKNKESTQKKAE